MKAKIVLIAAAGLSLFITTACHRTRDVPVAVPTVSSNPPSNPTPTPPPPPPPPSSHCLGVTVPWSLASGTLIHDNSQEDYTIPGFDASCGDSVRVYMRRPNTANEPWTEYFGVDNHASHYILHNGNVVTMYNETGIILELAIEAVLK